MLEKNLKGVFCFLLGRERARKKGGKIERAYRKEVKKSSRIPIAN